MQMADLGASFVTNSEGKSLYISGPRPEGADS